jgi:hypothetical protein
MALRVVIWEIEVVTGRDAEGGSLRTRLFHRRVEQGSSLATFERQQQLALSTLRAAGGQPVSYAALRQAGVEFPASVISELELAGVEVERSAEHVRARVGRVGQVRPEVDAAVNDARTGAVVNDARTGAVVNEARAGAADASAASGSRAVVASVSARTHRPTVRQPALGGAFAGGRLARAVFIAGPLLVVALLIVGLALGGGSPPTRAGARARAGAAAAFTSAPSLASKRTGGRGPAPVAGSTSRLSDSGSAAAGRQPEVPLRTPVSAVLATALEARGHGLIESGNYGEAIAVLQRALVATGKDLSGCLRPTSEACLTYAYALFDLGRTLLLGGGAAAAVGVLEDRLRIENQQTIVAAELEAARRHLG